MSRILTANSFSYGSIGSSGLDQKNKAQKSPRVLSFRERRKKKGMEEANDSGSVEASVLSAVFILVVSIIVLGAIYLYQVNDLATKGYEMREVEKQIQELDKEKKSMEIRETELKSMYNLEKATQDLNLVNSSNITYVELDSPFAMK